MPVDRNTVVRKPSRLTKSRTKALVADGLQSAVRDGDIERLALAGGVTTRCIQKALAHDTLPSFDVLLNMLDEEPGILTPALAEKGFHLTPTHAEPANDMQLAAGLGHTLAELIERLRDGKRCHVDTAVLASLFRSVIPQMQAIVDEDDARRAAA